MDTSGRNVTSYTTVYSAESSRNWNADQDINKLFLRSVQNYVNDRLKVRGVVFLNEVLDELALARVRLGQSVGWHISSGNPIEFEIGEPDDENGSMVLKFNVEYVLDKLD